MRLLSEKLSDQPESHSDKEKMAEFSVPTWMVRRKERIGGILVFSFNLLGLLNALLSGFSSLMFKMYYSNRVILYILSVQL